MRGGKGQFTTESVTIRCQSGDVSTMRPSFCDRFVTDYSTLLRLMDSLILLVGEGFDSEDRLELLVDYRLRLDPQGAIIRV
jgi:hypothetical protein